MKINNKLTAKEREEKTFNEKAWLQIFGGVSIEEILESYQRLKDSPTFADPYLLNQKEQITIANTWNTLWNFYHGWVNYEDNGGESIFEFLVTLEKDPTLFQTFLRGIENEELKRHFKKAVKSYKPREWKKRFEIMRENVLKLYEKHEARTDGRTPE